MGAASLTVLIAGAELETEMGVGDEKATLLMGALVLASDTTCSLPVRRSRRSRRSWKLDAHSNTGVRI